MENVIVRTVAAIPLTLTVTIKNKMTKLLLTTFAIAIQRLVIQVKIVLAIFEINVLLGHPVYVIKSWCAKLKKV